MIKELQLQNFKCFQQATSFELSRINLLTGVNGRGKSSLLQSLLILSQSAWENENLKKLKINGEYVELGNFDDIKNSETPKAEKIKFVFNVEPNSDIILQYTENERDNLSAECCKIETSNGNISDFIQSIKSIHFVSADRLGPLKYVDKVSLPEFIHVGTHGEYTINILANSINLPNVNDALYRGNDAASIIQQTIEWLAYILDGAKIDIKGLDKESSVLYMLLNNKNSSYASCGVQVFIESHSEHILNGLRVCVLNPEIRLNTNDISIHYFNESFNSEKLEMDEKAKIKNWPLGFFDQQENDLAEIFKYNR
jgi:predicted ATPase